MSRIYTTDEFEEAILANNPGCYLTLTQLGKLGNQDDLPREEEDLSDSDYLAELKVEALFQKLNPRPEVPGELMKPEPLSYDMEIQQLIRETHLIGISQGVSTVLSGGIRAPSPIPKPSKKKKNKRRSKRYSSKSDDAVLITSSSESVEIVEDPKKICNLVINPAAVKRQETSYAKQPKDKSAPKNDDVIEISSSEEEKKTKEIRRKKFFSPKELYEMKKKHKKGTDVTN